MSVLRVNEGTEFKTVNYPRIEVISVRVGAEVVIALAHSPEGAEEVLIIGGDETMPVSLDTMGPLFPPLEIRAASFDGAVAELRTGVDASIIGRKHAPEN